MISSSGLIILQIGIMFALLFLLLTVYHFEFVEYYKQVISNQETIINLLNSTKYP